MVDVCLFWDSDRGWQSIGGHGSFTNYQSHSWSTSEAQAARACRQMGPWKNGYVDVWCFNLEMDRIVMNTRNNDDQWLIWMCVFSWALSHSGAASINPTPHLRPLTVGKVVRILAIIFVTTGLSILTSTWRCVTGAPCDHSNDVYQTMCKFWNAKLWIQSDSGMLCFQVSASIFACPLLSLVQIWVKKRGPVHFLCPTGVSCCLKYANLCW